MTAALLDGTATAKAIKEELRAEIDDLKARGVRPGLGVLLAGENPASAVYVRNKTRACDELGIHHETALFPATTTHGGGRGQGRRSTAAREDIHGILVQLPLPAQVDASACCRLVDPAKDVDGFHPENVGRLVQKRPRFVPCTPAGIMELLARHDITVSGKRAVVLGRSDIVGKPMALLLMHADATVTVCHSRTPGPARRHAGRRHPGGGHGPARLRARGAREAGGGGHRRGDQPRRERGGGARPARCGPAGRVRAQGYGAGG